MEGLGPYTWRTQTLYENDVILDHGGNTIALYKDENDPNKIWTMYADWTPEKATRRQLDERSVKRGSITERNVFKD
jgi:hypothetical protein